MPFDCCLGNVLANAAGNLLSSSIKGLVNCVSGMPSNSLESEYGTLKMKVALLETLKMENDHKVNQQTRREASIDYQTWCNEVQGFLGNVEEFKVQYEQQRKRWSICMNKSGLSETLNQLLLSVQLHCQQGEFRERFLVDKPPQKVVKMNPPDIKTFPTLQGPLQKMLQFLSSERGKVFGIWGPLGVGKSTIMKNLNDHKEVENRFDIVIWIEASMESSKEQLQEVIAGRLKLNLEDRSHPEKVAERISEKLIDKKYLLLLDGVNDFIRLPEIGIPGNNNGSKVVFTTEFLRVCRLMTESEETNDKFIEVNPLSSEEAWRMFRQIVIDKIERPDVEDVGQKIVKECAGLPLLINKMGGFLKWKSCVDEWRNAREEFKDWSEAEIPGLKEISAFIRFCLDRLNSGNEKTCLLYVALHPADTEISTDYLVKCWAAERLLGNISDRRNLRAACDKGYAILTNLSEVSLLKKKMEHVQVNNMVHRVVLSISSREHRCEFLTAPLEVHDWTQARRIFMIDAKLDPLPDTPESSMLLSLLLQNNLDLNEIPTSFFSRMVNLSVLNLHGTGIETLPQSFEYLTTLKALFLNGCANLIDLPPQIGQLCLLEVLDIRGCQVIFIPTSIGELISLRCLKISYYKPSMQNGYGVMEIDYNVISRLSRLEELVIDVISYARWCDEATHVIQQVASLGTLTSLKICFPKLDVLQNLLEYKTEWQGRQKLTSFWFFVGRPSSNPPEILDCFDYKINRYLRYCHDGNDHNSTVPNVFPEIDALELIGHDSITCLLEFMQAPGLNGVRGCLAEGCNRMETVVGENNARGTNILSTLEQLHLRNLPVLRSMLEGPMSQESLSKLHTIVIESCPLLTKISSDGLILTTIRKLVIQNCPKIEELIRNGVGSMHNLKILKLLDMPQLRTIGEDASLAWPHLNELKICKCPELKRLPFRKENAAVLALIEGEQAWWDALQWGNNEIKEHFQSIFIPTVSA